MKVNNNNNGEPTTPTTPDENSSRRPTKSTNKIAECAKNFVDKITNTNLEDMKAEFKNNSFYCTSNFSANAFLKNKDANRFEDIPCLDSTRVVLDPAVGATEGLTLTDYIHANYVDIPGLSYRFIATQLPLKSTHNDFWRMIYQENVSTVIVFCDEEEIATNEDAPEKLFPNTSNDNMQLETIYLMNKKNGETSGFNHSIIEVLPSGCSHSNVVKVIQTSLWPRDSVPSSRLKVLRLLKAIFGSTCVLVCTSGIARSGTFMLIAAMKGCISSNATIDGMELFKMIRNQRAYAVQSFKHYVFAYTVIMEYIKIRIKGKFDSNISKFFAISKKYLT
uniref:Tyrosine-protein phosphatase domain-containing protein n=1 Tax=Parastrongyloides trichosuri TaxID=131310 RepID=A0A0N4Z4R7_PARTI